MELEGYPGGDLVARGIADLREGELSDEALLVAIGAPRLRGLGLALPPFDVPDPEHRLYERLARADPEGAHGRYNALVRRLVRFARAVECVR